MRIVIIGGSGHVGTYLVPMLVGAGHQVVNVSRGQAAPYLPNAAWDAVETVVADRTAAPQHSIPFDMFGVEFTHRGDRCTFEVLCQAFSLSDSALARVAGIVHDIDVKDGRFGAPHAAAVGLLVEGLQRAHGDDHELLARGMNLFEALYQGFALRGRTGGPRLAGRAASTGRKMIRRKQGGV